MSPSRSSPALLGSQLLGGERPQLHNPAVGQHHRHGDHLIDRFAVLDRAGAGRVVRDHAPHIGAVGGRDIRGELQAVGGEEPVQFVPHDARFDRDGSRLGVEVENPGKVLREVDDDRLAHRLAGQRGAAAAGQQRHAIAPGQLEHHAHIRHALRQHHPMGGDLVGAGVGRVQRARPVVEAHLALGAGGKLLRQRRHRHPFVGVGLGLSAIHGV